MANLFETERLRFAVTGRHDFDALYACLNEKAVSDAIYFIPHPCPEAFVQDWISRAQDGVDAGTEWLFSVFLKDGGGYIGSINVHRDGETPQRAEVGYWLAPAHWGLGYGVEMLSGAVNFAFDILGFEGLFATTAMDNAASRRVLEKQGFVMAGQKDVRMGEDVRPSFVYEIKNPAI